MAYSPLEKSYMDSVAEYLLPQANAQPDESDMQLASSNQVMSDAPGIVPIPQTGFEKVMEKTGLTLEQIGSELDKIGKLNIGGVEIGIRDLLPFVGSIEDGKLTGTPAALQAAGRGESLITGTGFTTQLKPDAKMMALDVATAGVAKPMLQAGKAAAKGVAKSLPKDLPVGMSIKALDEIPTGQPRQSVVSTRLPTAVKATENPLESNLIIDFDAVKKDPEAFKHNMGLIQQYPNFASKAKNPERRAEDFITEVKDNLLFLHDNVPDATRQRSKLWYDGARNIVNKWTNQYNVPDDAISGVLAVLSPQKDWFMNVSLGERVLDIMSTKRGIKWDSSMDEIGKVIWAKPQYAEMVNSIRGKSLDELQDDGLKAMWLRTYDQAKNPREHNIVSPEGDFVGIRMTDKGQPYKTGWGSLSEIGKAIKIFENPTVENISNNLGSQHKVRNFYNNIYDPTNPAGYVTIDTHAVAAGLLRPLSGNSREVSHNFGSNVLGEVGPKNSSVTGVQGTYGLYAEAYRRAAQERGVLPREMQSITWEAVRGLFPDTFKNAKNNELVDSIWLKYRKGQISQEEARNEVLKSAGGINAPEWERTGRSVGSAQEVQRTSNEGELFGVSVPRGDARELGSGKRTRATKGTSPSVTPNNNLPSEGM